jgi:hypothetical protein
MTPLQDKLRAAVRQTAGKMPAQAPPLRLSPQPRAGQNGRHGRHTRWRAWAAPLAAAALVIAAIAGALTVAVSLKHEPATARQSAGPYGVPAYYVALITAKPRSDVGNELGSSSWTDTAAELRSTQTGAVLAKVTPPKPYVSFTGVTAAADDRTFVLSAQGPLRSFGVPPYPAQRFFLLRIDQASQAGTRMTLTALPAGYVPAGNAIHDMALSPDGTQLAADIGADPPLDQKLYVFDLVTGTERAWSARTCAKCLPGSGSMVYGGVNTDALSWTADSQEVAFIWGHTVPARHPRRGLRHPDRQQDGSHLDRRREGAERVARGHHHSGRPDRARHRAARRRELGRPDPRAAGDLVRGHRPADRRPEQPQRPEAQRVRADPLHQRRRQRPGPHLPAARHERDDRARRPRHVHPLVPLHRRRRLVAEPRRAPWRG